MLVFSNYKESFILKMASFLGAFASLIPVNFWIIGKSKIEDAVSVFLLFAGLAAVAFIVRRHRAVELHVTDKSIELIYPIKKDSVLIQYNDIQEVIFSDLSMSLSILLKDGNRIPLGSSLEKQSGNFTVSELGPAAIQGTPGERLRLKYEIEARLK